MATTIKKDYYEILALRSPPRWTKSARRFANLRANTILTLILETKGRKKNSRRCLRRMTSSAIPRSAKFTTSSGITRTTSIPQPLRLTLVADRLGLADLEDLPADKAGVAAKVFR